jgi:hypothetical protein
MSAKQPAATKSNRVTAVQVPGESSASTEVENAEVNTETEDQGTAGAAEAPSADTIDPEAHAALQAENEELRAQIAASGRAPAAGREVQAVKNRADYLNMRSADVDPKTLTKAVLTKDGWVCPPAITQVQPK